MSIARNTNVATSPHQERVTAAAGLNFQSGITWTSFGGPAADAATTCVGIELLTAGTLSYTDVYGNTRTFAGLPAGYRPIEATAILTGTTVDVLVYF